MSQAEPKKLALVTGASGGIGSAIAKRLAQDGAAVLLHYHSDRAGAELVLGEIQKQGGEAAILNADLSQSDGPTQLIAQIDQAFAGQFAGRLDVLVNNAGAVDVAELADASDEAFDRLFNLNVLAVFQLSREAARRMTQSGWGRIINIGSVFGEAAFAPGLGIYCGTKFAVQGFTRAWSRDLGSKGITVNNVQPAVIQPAPQPTEGPTFDAMKRYTSVGRFGKPEEVAEVVAFLAGSRASFINGANWSIDGGWSA
jgi:3-oxoacyl-[acyl-carrier protein] reductase